MNRKHKIEIFSAGCATCKETIEMVRKIAGADHEIQIHDMHQHEIASRAKQQGAQPARRSNRRQARRMLRRTRPDEHVLREALR